MTPDCRACEHSGQRAGLVPGPLDCTLHRCVAVRPCHGFRYAPGTDVSEHSAGNDGREPKGPQTA